MKIIRQDLDTKEEETEDHLKRAEHRQSWFQRRVEDPKAQRSRCQQQQGLVRVRLQHQHSWRVCVPGQLGS